MHGRIPFDASRPTVADILDALGPELGSWEGSRFHAEMALAAHPKSSLDDLVATVLSNLANLAPLEGVGREGPVPEFLENITPSDRPLGTGNLVRRGRAEPPSHPIKPKRSESMNPRDIKIEKILKEGHAGVDYPQAKALAAKLVDENPCEAVKVLSQRFQVAIASHNGDIKIAEAAPVPVAEAPLAEAVPEMELPAPQSDPETFAALNAELDLLIGANGPAAFPPDLDGKLEELGRRAEALMAAGLSREDALERALSPYYAQAIERRKATVKEDLPRIYASLQRGLKSHCGIEGARVQPESALGELLAIAAKGMASGRFACRTSALNSISGPLMGYTRPLEAEKAPEIDGRG